MGVTAPSPVDPDQLVALTMFGAAGDEERAFPRPRATAYWAAPLPGSVITPLEDGTGCPSTSPWSRSNGTARSVEPRAKTICPVGT